MIVFDMNYDYLCRYLCICDVYVSLNYPRTGISNRKWTIRSQQKVNRLKVILSGGVWFDKNLSGDDSLFVPSDEENYEGGGRGNDGNEKRTYCE